MKSVICTLLVTLGAANPALAGSTYTEGTYQCKGRQGLPGNTYSVRSIDVGGVRLPFVEATRHYRRDPGNPESPVEAARVSGIAAVSSAPSSTVLMVAALSLEFVEGKLVGCEQ